MTSGATSQQVHIDTPSLRYTMQNWAVSIINRWLNY